MDEPGYLKKGEKFAGKRTQGVPVFLLKKQGLNDARDISYYRHFRQMQSLCRFSTKQKWDRIFSVAGGYP